MITAAILTVGLLPLLIDFGHGTHSMDFINQQIPFIIETKRLLTSGSPWWSWNTFFGDNFIGAYSFYTLTSPFVWLTCLFPTDKILWGILLSLYLKTLCTSAFSYLYFRKMEFSRNLSITGALLYTFSSFYICNLFYFHFCEPIMLMPLLLIAIENIMNNKRLCYLWLALISFLVIFINFYFSISTFLIGFIYFIFRARSKQALSWMLVFKVCGTVITGCLLSSFILLPTVMHNIGVPRAKIITEPIGILGFSSFNGMIAKYIDLFLCLLFPKVTEGLSACFFADLFGSNQGFISVFGWLPAAVYALKKRNWLSWILLVLFVCYFTPLGGIFSLFTSATYTRWLYGLILIGNLTTLFFIKESGRMRASQLLTYTALCAGMLFAYISIRTYHAIGNGESFTISHIENLVIRIWLINLACLILLMYKPSPKLTIGLVALCSALNLAAFVHVYFNTNTDPEQVE